jgi:hypothetical protein
MWRVLVGCLAAAVLGLGIPPSACAQPPPTTTSEKKSPLQELRWRDDQPGSTLPSVPKDSGGHVPVFEYFLAIAATIVVMLIICTPSRKRQ